MPPLDESLRTRLEAMNRGPLPAPLPSVIQRAAGAAARSTRPASPTSSAWRAGMVKAISGLVRRGECVTTDAGDHWRVCVPVDAIWPGGEDLVRRRCEAVRAAGESEEWFGAFPDGVAFLDLETCGLSGSALFLAGVLRPVDGRLAVELLLARDYSEEPAVLASLWQRLAGVSSLVTFNGKSFDWPMVVDRSRRHLLTKGAVAGPQHVDLLHLSRRRWRRDLPDCKLQTLERHICGRSRVDDMPSSQIPAAYQQYVKTGFEREMDAILMHNAVDLVTMLDLAMRLAGPIA
jgi:uncharacterized protein YprB with RNaseH-like and TPR domain